jgi:flagellar hook-basal body complex protein FliE
VSAEELSVSGVGPRSIGPKPPVPPSIRRGETSSFKDLLVNSISEVQRLQTQADQSIRELVSGEIADVSQVLVAIEKADIAFNTMMQIRNKIVEAYQEVIRMSV